MEISDLNSQYLSWFADLFRNRGVFGDDAKMYSYFRNVLFEAYKGDLERLLKTQALATAEEVFYLNFRHRMFIPRRTWFFGRYNQIARKLLKKYRQEFLAALADLENESSAAALTDDAQDIQADETTALDKPVEQHPAE